MNEELLYGKATRAAYGIVSIEIQDDIATLFIQDEDGSVHKQLAGNKYWILTNDKRSNWPKLKGNNYYQYGCMFESREEFESKRKELRKAGKDIYSIYDPKEAFQVLKGYTYYRGLKPTDPSILSFDLETTGLLLNKDSKVLLISNTFRKNEKQWNTETEEWEDNFIIKKNLFCYDDFHDEGEMIQAWAAWVRQVDPSIICGHNIQSFDFSYLSFIAKKHGVELNLGRDGSALKTNHYESKFRKDGSQDLHYFKNSIWGREIVDTMFVSYKFDVARNFPSYGLKSIMNHLNLEKKNRAFYDASKIRHNYKDPIEWQKIKEYCIDDSDDALTLYDLMAPPFFYMANHIPKSFTEIINGATGSQINSILVRAYIQNGQAIPKASEINPIKGGISLGNAGIYKNCWKIDIKSCYPSAILINNLYSKNKDPEAYMYKICEYFTLQRYEYKRLYKETNDNKYLALDQAAKIFINSIFGFCSAPGLNFNDSDVSAKITEFGRNYLSMGMKWATEKDAEYWINNGKID